MQGNSVQGLRRFGCAARAATLALLLLPLDRARAADLLGPYLGVSFGQAHVVASLPVASQFGSDHSAFKVMAGLRPIPLLGAELDYLDFGHPATSGTAFSSDVSMKGVAAFGMLYLPVPVVDVYAKGGLARLQSTANVNVPCITPFCAIAFYQPLNRANTSWAAGAGAQFKLGAVGIRAEYERFNAAGGNPYLLSLGATWTF